MTTTITVIVSPSDHIIARVGVQGPAGPKGNTGVGFTVYDTTVDMFAVTGDAGDIAYCTDYPDQHWKWSSAQNTWIPAF